MDKIFKVIDDRVNELKDLRATFTTPEGIELVNQRINELVLIKLKIKTNQLQEYVENNAKK